MEKKLFSLAKDSEKVSLHSPVTMPKASGFLWNRRMMIQMNCRGYAVSQIMQPEPAKYSFSPNIEATTFMQPEHNYYAHHPGRFFYIKDNDQDSLFSLPYEPVRAELDSYDFELSKDSICWRIKHNQLSFEIQLNLTADDIAELWQIKVENQSEQLRDIQLYPNFSIGFMSWMNQSATFNKRLNAVVAHKITPYQKVEDYPKSKEFNEYTYMLAEQKPDSACVSQQLFEGEGGLHNPDAIQLDELPQDDALYQPPTAAFKYAIKLQPGEQRSFRFVFGAAKNVEQIEHNKKRYFDTANNGFGKAIEEYQSYIAQGESVLQVETPDDSLNHFVNHWLPRQMFYHGDVNRLSTDPQTRNYLQDNMGMCYLQPDYCRTAFITALSQQLESGEMPDGILIHPDAELKYINQVPHADHCVWLPICLQTYLNESGDFGVLKHRLPFADNVNEATVFEHINRAMQWLKTNLDHRQLSLIAQGDWCDPMNMVGYKGKGVSAWLTLATAWAYKEWAKICVSADELALSELWLAEAAQLNEAVNEQLWDGNWYARGITDDGNPFGISDDIEGRIFLNPQSWAILSGAADSNKKALMLPQIERQLATPYGVTMLAPAYTKMREDVGRVTQKFPGSSENGSVYNHAAAFYAYALYQCGEPERAFQTLKHMLVSDLDAEAKGQLPVFIPNYYRGAYFQYPETAGRSSQLFNTGTIAWFYRCLVEGLFGVKADEKGISFSPQMPEQWNKAKVTRYFRGARFIVDIKRSDSVDKTEVKVDGVTMNKPVFDDIEDGKSYRVSVLVPRGSSTNEH